MKTICVFFVLMILSGSAIAQQSDNMMAITSAQDTVYFSAPDSATRLNLPPKTIRLFTTSQMLQKRLASTYPGIKWVPYFGTPAQALNDSVRTEVIIPTSDRPYIYMKKKYRTGTTVSANTGTLGYGKTLERTFIINGTVLPSNKWQTEVKSYLRTDPECQVFIKNGEESDKWVGWGAAIGIGGVLMTLFTADFGDTSEDIEINLDEPQEEKKIKGATVIGLVMFVTGGAMMALNWDGSEKQLIEGIKVYNSNLAKLKGEELPADLYETIEK